MQNFQHDLMKECRIQKILSLFNIKSVVFENLGDLQIHKSMETCKLNLNHVAVEYVLYFFRDYLVILRHPREIFFSQSDLFGYFSLCSNFNYVRWAPLSVVT